MLENQNIICISSIDWDFIWQGHQEIMSTLARNGNRVIFIENTGVRVPSIRDILRIKNRIKNWFKGIKGIRKEKDNLYIFSPMILPFPYFRFANWINSHSILSILEKWMEVIDFSNPIIWTFLPTPLSLNIADNLKKKILIYYCIDDFSVSSVSVKKIKKSEKKLLKKTDLVFVTSKALYNYCSEYNDKVYTFPFAVKFKEFERIRLSKQEINELGNFRRPIIGYVGGIHKWIDQGLIKSLALMRPEYSFVFIGPIQTDISLLAGIKNINFLGKRNHEKIPCLINSFDACLIPYLLTDYTKNVYPTKLNEYLAMGKAVISRDLPEVVAFKEMYGDIIYIAEDSKGFSHYIDIALNENNHPLKERRIDVARENSWENRIEEMSELIESMIEKKKTDINDRWKESLIYFYNVTRRRLFRLVTTFLLLYLVLFRTPFIWLCAEPLKITGTPNKADAIVVFAGGVGESGMAGQGYEERVKYAVELYKKGYSHHLIFSSGYGYAFREPEIMKILAVSMGVPEGVIFLEQKAANTYQNVKFTKEILNKNALKSILFVSSPYHMRRASLTFKKIAPDIAVIYTPIPNSHFYGRANSIKLEQIRGIIHEYLGIVYYWWKGYI